MQQQNVIIIIIKNEYMQLVAAALFNTMHALRFESLYDEKNEPYIWEIFSLKQLTLKKCRQIKLAATMTYD
jgi:hypothetical protein